MALLATAALASLFAALNALDSDASPAESAGPYPPTKVAFIGDQSLSLGAQQVLAMIVDEGAEAILFHGDFDYTDNPGAWEAQFDAYLPAGFPVFASIGNHDLCCTADSVRSRQAIRAETQRRAV